LENGESWIEELYLVEDLGTDGEAALDVECKVVALVVVDAEVDDFFAIVEYVGALPLMVDLFLVFWDGPPEKDKVGFPLETGSRFFMVVKRQEETAGDVVMAI
jgi:hypothetical protein